jgi:hypothetical protein
LCSKGSEGVVVRASACCQALAHVCFSLRTQIKVSGMSDPKETPPQTKERWSNKAKAKRAKAPSPSRLEVPTPPLISA